MIEQQVKLYKVLADKSRLKILASLNKEPMYQELIASRLKLNPSTVSFHIKKLEEVGLINASKEQYYKVYSLNKESLNKNILASIEKIKLEQTEEEREQEYEEKIKRTFFENGILKTIPVQRKKRLIVLKELAKEFELNKEYHEQEVNNIISTFHNDFCTLRREFIMNKLFTRDNNLYIRVQ